MEEKLINITKFFWVYLIPVKAKERNAPKKNATTNFDMVKIISVKCSHLPF